MLNIKENVNLMKMSGLQLSSLTTIDTLSCHGGAEVTHPLWV